MSKTVFDNFDSVTDWTASTGASIYGVNDYPDLIAGDLSGSLILYFNGINEYCTKTYSTPISTTGYTDITFWIWSRNLRTNDYRTKDDFSYKIDFGSGKEYYLPCYSDFFSVTISTADIATIERIKITALTGTTDYLVISYGVLSVDELPLDIFTGLKEKLESDITDNYLTSYLIGTISGIETGDSSITFTTNPEWIDRYITIYITDGVNSEIHTIKNRNGKTFELNSTHDGSSIIHDYTTANVYIYLPVVIGNRQSEIELPSITIWGIEPEKIFIGHQLENVLDSYNTSDTFYERREGQFLKYGILIDCEAREDELLNVCSRIVRDNIGRRYIWVNGQKIDIEFSGVARETEPTDTFQIIPKIEYIADVVIKEELWKRVKLYATTDTNITLTLE